MAALLLTSPALSAETKTFDVLDLLRALKVAPNTEALALRQGYVLRGIQDGAADAKPQAGDTVTALVELGSFYGKRPSGQWIIRLRLAAKPPDDTPQAKASKATLYTNTGEKFTFHSEWSGMHLETLGPIRGETKPGQSLPVKRQEISVATDFLGLDLYRTAQINRRLIGSKLVLKSGPNPYPADELNVQQPLAAALKLTSEDLRSFSGSVPALEQFLRIVRLTPGLQDILYQVLDKPSVLDVLTHGSESSLGFNFLGSGPSDGQEIFWPDGGHENFGVLFFNITVFGKPVLTVTLFVTTPRSPLLVSAGIVGLVAWSPGKPDKIVGVRVLSATAGAEPGPPPGPKS